MFSVLSLADCTFFKHLFVFLCCFLKNKYRTADIYKGIDAPWDSDIVTSLISLMFADEWYPCSLRTPAVLPRKQIFAIEALAL